MVYLNSLDTNRINTLNVFQFERSLRVKIVTDAHVDKNITEQKVKTLIIQIYVIIIY